MEGNLVRYYFKPSGKLNQGNTLYNRSKTPMFEANLKKFRLFSASDYEFINHFSGNTTLHKVGKTVTTSYGSSNVSVVANSYFKFDGENIHDFLRENGVSYDYVIEKLVKPIYTIYYHNEVIAKVETSSVNLFEDDHKFGLNIPCPGYYRVDMNEDYAFLIFVCLFSFPRLEISVRS